MPLLKKKNYPLSAYPDSELICATKIEKLFAQLILTATSGKQVSATKVPFNLPFYWYALQLDNRGNFLNLENNLNELDGTRYEFITSQNIRGVCSKVISSHSTLSPKKHTQNGKNICSYLMGSCNFHYYDYHVGSHWWANRNRCHSLQHVLSWQDYCIH